MNKSIAGKIKQLGGNTEGLRADKSFVENWLVSQLQSSSFF